MDISERHCLDYSSPRPETRNFRSHNISIVKKKMNFMYILFYVPPFFWKFTDESVRPVTKLISRLSLPLPIDRPSTDTEVIDRLGTSDHISSGNVKPEWNVNLILRYSEWWKIGGLLVRGSFPSVFSHIGRMSMSLTAFPNKSIIRRFDIDFECIPTKS